MRYRLTSQYNDTGKNLNLNRKFCDCPGSEPGKVRIDASAHLAGCWIRKQLLNDRRYSVDTNITSREIEDGYRLGGCGLGMDNNNDTPLSPGTKTETKLNSAAPSDVSTSPARQAKELQ